MTDFDMYERIYNAGLFGRLDLERLIANAREYEADAARYRFMRDSGKFLESGEEFDAAIDQAMKEKGNE